MLPLPVKSEKSRSFDLTPIIDIVFLIIIFFMLVFQFIAAQHFEIEVPDRIDTASAGSPSKNLPPTLTVMLDDSGATVYAVGSEVVQAVRGEKGGQGYDRTLAAALTSRLNARLEELPVEKRTVTVRIDKTVPFAYCREALAAVSRSNAETIKLAVRKDAG